MNNQKTVYLRILLMLILSFTGTTEKGYAREPLRFDHVLDLGVPGGQTCVQDNDGFLWFGSDGGGMFRYDGYDVKNYGVGPKQLSNGNVWRILEDRENPDIFWIGSSGGLNRFDKATETFTHYLHDPQDPQSLGDNTVQDLIQDGRDANILWLGTAGGGLNKFDKTTGRVVRYEPDPARPDSLSFPDVWRLIEDVRDPNILWVGTYGGGLEKFDKSTETFTHYAHDPQNPQSLSARGNNIDALIQDKDEPYILWIGTPEDGLDKFDTRTGTFSNFSADLTNGEVALIYDDGRGALWLGGYVMNNGLTLFDKTAETFVNYTHHPQDSKSLSNDLVVNVYEDRSGIVWVTTYSGKIDKIDPYSQNFALYQRDPNNPASLYDNAVTTLYEDRQGRVWFGTQGGLHVFDRATGHFSRYLHDDNDPDSVDVDYVLGIYEDSAGDFWVSLYVGPLIRLDPDTGKVLARYQTEAESLTKIIEDPHNPDLLWMGTHTAGLARFDKASETFTMFPPDPEQPQQGPSNSYVQTLVHDRNEDVLWFGGYFGGGLNKFDKGTQTFTHYLADPNNPDSLAADAISALYQDASGLLWIGTKGGGLDAFDPQTQVFTRHAKKHGVPPEINAILEDRQGKLWLSTNDGLVCFNPVSQRVEARYMKEDGLQGNAFLHGSALTTSDGQLWFGGTNGANSFDPESLVRNPSKPPVIFTAVTQGGEAVNWDHHTVPARLQEITLPWQHNFFEFEFVALNYTSPLKNQYKYMLEGFDREWYDSGTRRFGRYSNLPGGTYTLRILGSNNDGVWNEQGASLLVHVILPFWATQWFKSLMTLLILGLGFSAYYGRMQMVKKQRQHLEHLVKQRTAELEEQRVKLQESEIRFRRLSEATFEGIIIHNDGHILDVNQAVERMFGCEREELLNKNALDFLTPTSRQIALQQIAAKSETLYEIEGQRKDGAVFPIEVQTRLIPYQDRTVRVAALRDISWRKQAEAMLRQLEKAVETTEVGITITDPDGRIVYTNPAEASMHSYTTGELLGQYANIFAPPECRKPQEDQSDTEKFSLWQRERINIRKDGSTFPVKLISNPILDAQGQIIGNVVVCEDITLRKHAEFQLLSAHQKLKEKNAQLAELNASKDKFFSIISHDLRSPLNVILGYSQLVEENFEEYTPQETKTYIQKIRTSTESLYALLQNLLTWARIQRGVLQHFPEKLDLREIVEQNIELFVSKAEQKQLVLSNAFEQAVYAYADEQMVHTVLRNLLSNALKFTPAGGVIQILAQEQNAHIELAVADTGPGICQENLPRLFRIDSQYTNAGTDGEKGAGLGLSLCKELVEKNGGTIWVESEVGKGTAFRFTLPKQSNILTTHN